LIREQDNLVQLGVINTTSTSNKALVVHQKDKPKNPKKQHPRHKNKKYKGPKPTEIVYAPNGDKGEKYKSKKTEKHCRFFDKVGHDESKCFNRMASLEVAMKKNNINIDSTSSSSSHGHTLSTSGFSFNTTSTSIYNEWIIDSRASYHMAKDRDIFYTLNECNTKKIFVGDDRYLSVVGTGTVQVDNGHFNDVLCVPSLSCNLQLVYQITHSGEGKTVDFSPQQVIIKNLKDPKHVLATKIVDDITRLHNFDNFGSSSFSSVFVAMKLLLEEMLNLMKISWPVSLIRRLCLLWPVSLIRWLCLLRPASHLRCLFLLLFWFLLQMMTMRMKIHLRLLTFLQMSPLNLNQHQLHRFLDGFVQHKKQLVILSVILQISVRHVHSSSEPLLFWLKFQKLMIQRHLQKLQVIQIGIQQ
jgi:hypothetical protein